MQTEPRAWWPSSGRQRLDVEQLACSAVHRASAAAQTLTHQRGLNLEISTSPALIATAFASIDHLRVDGHPANGWASLSGWFQAGDGWVRLHANYPHHASVLHRLYNNSSRVGNELTREQLAAVLRERNAQQIEDEVYDARGIAVKVRTPTQWASHPQAVATANTARSQVVRWGDRPILPAAHALPLEGVRILDLTRVIAGPVASQVLACLGADVLRIDPPQRPELLDHHLSTGMGKRWAYADLNEHANRVQQLADKADVVLLGYRPGALDKFGLSAAALADRNPHAVIVELSAWGHEGPWANRAGFDSIVQAATGIATITSTTDTHDGWHLGALPVQALDHSTGYDVAAIVMDHLAHAHSATIRLSLLGAARELLRLPIAPNNTATAMTVDIAPLTVTVEALNENQQPVTITTIPPALFINNKPLHAPIQHFANDQLQWA